jgi:hypothetical protein
MLYMFRTHLLSWKTYHKITSLLDSFTEEQFYWSQWRIVEKKNYVYQMSQMFDIFQFVVSPNWSEFSWKFYGFSFVFTCDWKRLLFMDPLITCHWLIFWSTIDTTVLHRLIPFRTCDRIFITCNKEKLLCFKIN